MQEGNVRGQQHLAFEIKSTFTVAFVIRCIIKCEGLRFGVLDSRVGTSPSSALTLDSSFPLISQLRRVRFTAGMRGRSGSRLGG
jgi:hypothetical protein